MTKPFASVRILDFSRYVAGPFGSYQLALLGAEGGTGSIERALPLLGERTDEIPSEAGYSVGEIEMFRHEAVV